MPYYLKDAEVLKVPERFDENAFLPTSFDIEAFLIAFAVAFGASGGIVVSWSNGNVVIDLGKLRASSAPNACGP